MQSNKKLRRRGRAASAAADNVAQYLLLHVARCWEVFRKVFELQYGKARKAAVGNIFNIMSAKTGICIN